MRIKLTTRTGCSDAPPVLSGTEGSFAPSAKDGIQSARLHAIDQPLISSSAVAESITHGRGNGVGGFFSDDNNGNYQGGLPQRVYITGMLIALGGILMFFTALVSAWVVRRGFPNTDWQPIALPRILWLNTLILLASSAVLAFSRRCRIARRDSECRHCWAVTTILGMLFLAGQLLAWRQMFAAGLFLATNPGSSFFYVFTGAHGLHILGGIAALLWVGLRPSRRLTRNTATRVVALYWHFLGVIWVLIFALLVMER
jgi:cytochrome c oxidase subunit III